MKIAVIGERFYDRYLIGNSSRISPEAPVPVVNITEEKEFPGGAANVTNALTKLGVQTYTIYQDSPIPVKNRLMIGTTQVARWDERDKVEPPMPDPSWKANLISCDGVIISDYGKGMFTHTILSEIRKLTYNLGIPIFIDTKQNPQKYEFFDEAIFFPNSKEYLEFPRAYEEKDCVYKQGAAGMDFMRNGKSLWHEGANAEQVVSVIGCGDLVVAAFAYMYVRTKDAWVATQFASKAAALKVGKPFTSNPTLQEVECPKSV